MRRNNAPAPGSARAGPVALVLVLLAVVGFGWWLWARGDGRSTNLAVAENAVAKPIAVRPIIRRVERLRGLRFRRPLKVTFASPSEAASLIRSASEQENPRRDRLIAEEELKLLGLLAPDVDLEGVVRKIEEDELAGFYDSKSKRLVVIRAKTDSRALQEITLAHELTHALEDQHFGLPEPEGFSDDRGAAVEALFEGTATSLMTDYAERYLDFGDLTEILDDVAGADVNLPPFIERQLLFPYESGEQFVATFRERGNWRAIDQVVRLRQPRTTEQILHPERYAIDERPETVEISDLGRRLGSEWHRVDTTSIGEFDLESLFAVVGKTNGAKAAAGWDGGLFELWRRKSPSGCKAPCVEADAAFLRIAWDTARDRTEAEKAFKRVFERGLQGNRIAGDGVRPWSSRGGNIGMAGSGLRTTVVFAPDSSLATKLIE